MENEKKKRGRKCKLEKSKKFIISLTKAEVEFLEKMMEEDGKENVSGYFGYLVSEEFNWRKVEKERRKPGRPSTKKEEEEDIADTLKYMPLPGRTDLVTENEALKYWRDTLHGGVPGVNCERYIPDPSPFYAKNPQFNIDEETYIVMARAKQFPDDVSIS